MQQLIDEYRRLESLCAKLAPSFSALANGRDVVLDPTTSSALVTDHLAQAGFEEARFLPLAQRILGRNSHHMAALRLSLHIRQASQDFRHKFGFI